jgi:hypothetical protein
MNRAPGGPRRSLHRSWARATLRGLDLAEISPTGAVHDGELTWAVLKVGEELVWAGGGGRLLD